MLGQGIITPFDELERKISFVSADGVRRAVNEHLYDRDVAIAGAGTLSLLGIVLSESENNK